MTDYDNAFQTVCRICLTSYNSNTVSLLDERGHLNCYGQSVLSFANVTIAPRDGLPSQMCCNCLYLLKHAIKFKLTCEQSHRELSKLISERLSGNYKRNVVEYSLYHEILPGTSQFEDTTDLARPELELNNLQEELHNTAPDVLNDEFFSPNIDLLASSIDAADTILPEPVIVPVKKERKTEKKDKDVDFDELINKMEEVINAKLTKRHQSSGDTLKHDNKDSKPKTKSKEKGPKKRSKKLSSAEEVEESPEDALLFAMEKMVDMAESKLNQSTLATTTVQLKPKNWRSKKQKTEPSESTNLEHMTASQRYRHRLSLRRRKDWLLAREAAKSRHTPKQCKICKKTLANANTLYAHMQRHQTHKYICEHCAKSFTTNSELQAHLVARHGAGKYMQCPHCDFKAARNYDMNEHARTHTGERPFACDKCGLTFTRQSVWRRHRRYHQDKRFQCPLCPRRFHFREHMSAHSNNVHSRQYVFACPRCGATYAKTGTVRRHLAEKHNVPREQQGKILRLKRGEVGANFTEH